MSSIANQSNKIFLEVVGTESKTVSSGSAVPANEQHFYDLYEADQDYVIALTEATLGSYNRGYWYIGDDCIGAYYYSSSDSTFNSGASIYNPTTSVIINHGVDNWLSAKVSSSDVSSKSVRFYLRKGEKLRIRLHHIGGGNNVLSATVKFYKLQ